MCAVHYTDLQKIHVTKYLIIVIHSFATFMSNFRFITPNIIKNFDPYIQIDNVENEFSRCGKHIYFHSNVYEIINPIIFKPIIALYVLYNKKFAYLFWTTF